MSLYIRAVLLVVLFRFVWWMLFRCNFVGCGCVVKLLYLWVKCLRFVRFWRFADLRYCGYAIVVAALYLMRSIRL